VGWWQDRLYPTQESRDPRNTLLTWLEGVVTPEARILDVGAGAGERNPHRLKGRCREVVGVDFDPRVASNPLLDRGVVMTDERLPFPDGYFDVAFSIYVLEHVERPRAFAAELRRVLRPGGTFLSVMPNRFHYVALIASVTPTSFHRWYNALRGRPHDDTFSTFYRLNTPRRVEQVFGQAGFRTERLETVEVQPNYLMMTLPTFLAGALYERAVNACSGLAPFRAAILVQLRRG
jgi:SAM-dependent methyltransferase